MFRTEEHGLSEGSTAQLGLELQHQAPLPSVGSLLCPPASRASWEQSLQRQAGQSPGEGGGRANPSNRHQERNQNCLMRKKSEFLGWRFGCVCVLCVQVAGGLKLDKTREIEVEE